MALKVLPYSSSKPLGLALRFAKSDLCTSIISAPGTDCSGQTPFQTCWMKLRIRPRSLGFSRPPSCVWCTQSFRTTGLKEKVLPEEPKIWGLNRVLHIHILEATLYGQCRIWPLPWAVSYFELTALLRCWKERLFYFCEPVKSSSFLFPLNNVWKGTKQFLFLVHLTTWAVKTSRLIAFNILLGIFLSQIVSSLNILSTFTSLHAVGFLIILSVYNLDPLSSRHQ